MGKYHRYWGFDAFTNAAQGMLYRTRGQVPVVQRAQDHEKNCCDGDWPHLHIDPTLLSPVSVLLGAIVGGSASLVAAIYTQRC